MNREPRLRVRIQRVARRRPRIPQRIQVVDQRKSPMLKRKLRNRQHILDSSR